jgi:DNA-binding IclR family transcriptional regulator
MGVDPDPGNGSRAVDRAAALLTLVVESPQPRSFTSLVGELGLAKSTTSRLLNALQHNRLLQRDRSGGFRPGPLFLTYATRHDPEVDLVELARPALELIGQRTGETVNLAVPRRDGVAQVDQVDSSYLLGATNWVGVDVPAHCSALGKVFYAAGAIPLPDGPLQARTPHSIGTLEQLDRELATVRRQGWAMAWEELEEGLVALAAPVCARGGSVVAAMSVSGPTARITRPRARTIGRLLVGQARGLSMLLGHAAEEMSEETGREGVA